MTLDDVFIFYFYLFIYLFSKLVVSYVSFKSVQSPAFTLTKLK